MHLQTECKNYIRILHKTEDNRMYVCGTNAFDPECDYMVRQIHILYCMNWCCIVYYLLKINCSVYINAYVFVSAVLCRWKADSGEERRGWQREVSVWSFPEIRLHHVWWVGKKKKKKGLRKNDCYSKMFSFVSLCLRSCLARKQPVLCHFNELPGLWTHPDAQLSCLHTHWVQELLASW